MKSNKTFTYLLMGLALLVLPLFLQMGGNAWVRIVDMALLYVLLALGLNIVVGYAGLLDLGYVRFLQWVPIWPRCLVRPICCKLFLSLPPCSQMVCICPSTS